MVPLLSWRVCYGLIGSFLLLGTVCLPGLANADFLTVSGPVTRFTANTTITNDSPLAQVLTNWVIEDGVVVTVNSNLSISILSLEIQGTGRIVQGQCLPSFCPKVDLLATSDVYISPQATIDVSGLGYLGGNQPGNTGLYGRTKGNVPHVAPFYTIYMSGSHGGFAATYPNVNDIYGDLRQPTLPGAGGSTSRGAYLGGNGGGVVHLKVLGNLILDGAIKANGMAATGSSGAGGSIWIETASLSKTEAGHPVIQANGASNRWSASGGGRVALYVVHPQGVIPYNSSTLQAFGGFGSPYGDGGPGTVFIKEGAQPGSLLVDNNGRGNMYRSTEFRIAEGTVLTLKNMSLSGAARVKQETSNFMITIQDTLSISADGSQSVLMIPDDGNPASLSFGHWSSSFSGRSRDWFSAANYSGIIERTNLIEYDPGALSTVTIGAANFDQFNNRAWTIAPFEQVIIDVAALFALDNLLIDKGGRISPSRPCTNQGCIPVNLHVTGNALIAEGGSIDASGMGYLGGNQPGNSSALGVTAPGVVFSTTPISATAVLGGSHGGFTVQTQPVMGGDLYGNLFQPTSFGAGGSANSSDPTSQGGNGGGVIRLDVDNTLTLNGAIRANGAGASSGGAGGSVLINANQLASSAGSPVVEAMGGNVDHKGGGAGGGGRVAVHYTSLSGFGISENTLKASGGKSLSYGQSGPGTVIFKMANDSFPSLMIANPDSAYQNAKTTEFRPPNDQDLLLKDLLILGGGRIKQESADFSIAVSGRLTLSGGNVSLEVPTNNASGLGSWFNYDDQIGVVPGGTLIEY